MVGPGTIFETWMKEVLFGTCLKVFCMDGNKYFVWMDVYF